MGEYASPTPLLQTALEATFEKKAKKHRVYVSYMKNSIEYRSYAAHQGAKLRGAHHQKEKLKFEEHLQLMSSSQFTISPQGLGQDCFRTWEALAVGSIPIVEDSGISSVYEHLPAVIIPEGSHGWSMLTDEFLESAEKNITSYSTNKLFLCHWWGVIRRTIRRHRRRHISKLQCHRENGKALGENIQFGGPVDFQNLESYLEKSSKLEKMGRLYDARECIKQAIRQHRGCNQGCHGKMGFDMTSTELSPLWVRLAIFDIALADYRTGISHIKHAYELEPNLSNRNAFQDICLRLKETASRFQGRFHYINAAFEECKEVMRSLTTQFPPINETVSNFHSSIKDGL
mmetsp:Transcript_43470/g.72248  ORF Transcript_43470/g.72248 Transcript_43470/m.72248 type:complete len:344 (-) Transcript_43470:148-1179(-)